MAQALIERWQLAVLRVRLEVGERLPVVSSELVSYADGTPRRMWEARHTLPEFGLAEEGGAPDDLRVPVELRDRVAEALDGDLRGGASLWVRLVPPYGYLGAVPWERSLLDVVDVPLFRVPDRLPVATDPGRRWSVALGVDTDPGAEWSAPYVRDLVEELGRATGPAVEVDVFADASTHARLARLGWTAPPWAHVHEPGAALGASTSRVRRLMAAALGPTGAPPPLDVTSPGRIWADWIATGLAGRAVRALHVVLDAVWDGHTPVLALSPDPSRPTGTDACAFVVADDVRRLADTVGAATLSLGSPPDVTSGTALRAVADGIGQQRPGTTLHSEIGEDPRGEALARMHEFLAARGPVEAPRHRSLFAYVQPELVQPTLARAWPQPAPTARAVDPGAQDPSPAGPLPAASLPSTYRSVPSADLAGYYSDAQSVPSWVAASERYVGGRLAHLARPGEDGDLPRPGDQEAYERGAAEALAQFQEIVAKHARP